MCVDGCLSVYGVRLLSFVVCCALCDVCYLLSCWLALVVRCVLFVACLLSGVCCLGIWCLLFDGLSLLF